MQFRSNLVPPPSHIDPKRDLISGEAADFRITRHMPGAMPGAMPGSHHMPIQHTAFPGHTSPVHQTQAPLVSTMLPALTGSAADVFNRSRVISITEPTQAVLTFENESTDFRNTLVMYRLCPDGTIMDTSIVFPNASIMDQDGRLTPGISQVALDFNAGDQVGFAMVPNALSNPLSRDLLRRSDGHFALVNALGQPANLFTEHPGGMNLVHVDPWGRLQPINGEYGNKLFHTTGNTAKGIQTNVDGHDHADQIIDPDRGLMLIGMDDRYAPENPGRDNLVFSLNIGETNARALMNQQNVDRPTSFRDMAGADRELSPAEAIAAARSFDSDGDGRLSAEEWAEFAPLLNLTADDYRHLFGPKGRGDIDGLANLLRIGDMDGSGTINERELLELGRRLNGNDPNVIQSFREAAGFDWKLDFEEFIATAESHDADLDGLNQEEWNRFAPVLGLLPIDRDLFLDSWGRFDVERFKSVFTLADTDGDGYLSPREVLELRRIVNEAFSRPDFQNF